jgi:hypothetical protein
MRNEKIPMVWDEIPKVGSDYLKLKTGEFVKWQSFNEEKQTFAIKLPSGKISKIHKRDIKMPTPNEVLDFIKSQNKNSN